MKYGGLHGGLRSFREWRSDGAFDEETGHLFRATSIFWTDPTLFDRTTKGDYFHKSFPLGRMTEAMVQYGSGVFMLRKGNLEMPCMRGDRVLPGGHADKLSRSLRMWFAAS